VKYATGKLPITSSAINLTIPAEGFTVYEAKWWHFDYKDWQKYHIGNVRFEQIGR
jgi:D-alanyl-D-alanine dipeptidase